MTPGAMLSVMKTSLTPRQLAGAIVRDEIAAQGLRQEDAAARANMAPSTLARVMRGEPNVKDITLRQIERPLGLPLHLLSHVIACDVDRIRTLNMDEGLRAYILTSIADVKRGGNDADAGEHGRRDA